MKLRWLALVAAAVTLLIAAAACDVNVPLGVDPQSDAARADGGDAGQ